MDGREFARIVEQELAARCIKKGDFYNKVGISATALYGWKRGAVPSAETIAAVEEYIGIPSAYANQRGGWAKDHVRQKTYTDLMTEGGEKVAKQVDDFFLGLTGKNPAENPGH